MRQFILAGNVAYGSSLPLANGAVAFTYLNNGVTTIDSDGSKLHEPIEGNLMLGRTADLGPVVLPFFNKHFTWVKGTYQAATTFVATVTIPTPEEYTDYGLTVVVKGKKFNERNRWDATIHTGANPTAAAVATSLAKHINNNTIGHGIVATVSSAQITLTATKPGVDYAILGFDELLGVTVTVTTAGKPAYGDGEYVKDLANKAAADAGFEYTYNDAELYGGYPIDKTQVAMNAGGYTIFTLRFAEPRKVARLDKLVHQIIQVAFPTGAAAISTFESVLKGIQGTASAAAQTQG